MRRPRLNVTPDWVTPRLVDPLAPPATAVGRLLLVAPGHPATVNVAGTRAVRSPFWSVSVAVAVPAGAWHVDRNRPSAPPASVTARLVSGMSGSPVNVAALVTRLTAPVNVSGNGEGNTSVSANPLVDPVRYAWPVSALGYSGEVAVAEPTG